jgi:hypothetical protein
MLVFECGGDVFHMTWMWVWEEVVGSEESDGFMGRNPKECRILPDVVIGGG